MKINLIIFCIAFLATVSCKKKDDVPDFESVNNVSDRQPSKPVLHMSFKAGTPEDEIEKQWDEAVLSLKNETHIQKTSGSDTYYYHIRTETGTKKYDATDSPVSGYVYFTKDGYLRGALDFYLNNPGDDREKGQIDLYLFPVEVEIPFHKIAFTSAYVEMGGNDGWGIEYFHAYTTAQMHEPGYPYLRCEGSVTTGGGYNNTCSYEGYTIVKRTSRVFIDRNNSNYEGRAYTTSSYGAVQVKSGDI